MTEQKLLLWRIFQVDSTFCSIKILASAHTLTVTGDWFVLLMVLFDGWIMDFLIEIMVQVLASFWWYGRSNWLKIYLVRILLGQNGTWLADNEVEVYCPPHGACDAWPYLKIYVIGWMRTDILLCPLNLCMDRPLQRTHWLNFWRLTCLTYCILFLFVDHIIALLYW